MPLTAINRSDPELICRSCFSINGAYCIKFSLIVNVKFFSARYRIRNGSKRIRIRIICSDFTNVSVVRAIFYYWKTVKITLEYRKIVIWIFNFFWGYFLITVIRLDPGIHVPKSWSTRNLEKADQDGPRTKKIFKTLTGADRGPVEGHWRLEFVAPNVRFMIAGK